MPKLLTLTPELGEYASLVRGISLLHRLAQLVLVTAMPSFVQLRKFHEASHSVDSTSKAAGRNNSITLSANAPHLIFPSHRQPFALHFFANKISREIEHLNLLHYSAQRHLCQPLRGAFSSPHSPSALLRFLGFDIAPPSLPRMEGKAASHGRR